MPTHYETLNVSETAPSEVIRAAYKALALIYHPDRNGTSNKSGQYMQSLNTAYEILSDHVQRSKYDQQLRFAREDRASKADAEGRGRSQGNAVTPSPEQSPAASPEVGVIRRFFRLVYSYPVLTLIAIILLIWVFSDSDTATSPQDTTSNGQSSPRDSYVRPMYSPMGTAWPTSAGYVSGYEVQAHGGLSMIRIDNSRNSSDVFLKLVYLYPNEAVPARMCFIPAYSDFTFSQVLVGRYDIRYRDLDTGKLLKTREFQLEEVQTSTGTEFSKYDLTLYKVANGNMRTFPIEESEF